MGSASSRPLQNLPKSLAHHQHQHKPRLPSAIPKPANTDDPPNPNLLSNLAQLGQVRVQNPAPHASRTMPSPSSSSPPTSTQPRNTLSAPALATLLATLKSPQHAPTQAHAKRLVHQQQFNLDWDVYQRLAKYVNTPSIGTQKHVQLNDNSVRILKQVIWVDPPYTRTEPPL